MLGSHFDLIDAIERKRSNREGVSEEKSCEELERDLTAVAKTVHHRTRKTWHFRCPVCDETMRVCDERDLKEFGGLDVKLHKLECDACGMLTGRVFHPSVGYDSHLVR